jgi:hypothetical protein
VAKYRNKSKMIKKKVFAAIVFSLVIANTYGQKRFLANFNFSNGRYSIFFLGIGGNTPDTTQRDWIEHDTTTNFFTHNVKKLLTLQKQLKVTKAKTASNCMPDYIVYVRDGDKTVLNFELVFCSKELIVNRKMRYSFKDDQIGTFIASLPHLEKIIYHPYTRASALKLWPQVTHDSTLMRFNHTAPDWFNYEGRFSITFRNKADEITVNKRLTKQLNVNYPKARFTRAAAESFKITDGPPIYLCTFYCDKDFYDKFNLYKKEEYEPYRDFSFSMYKKPNVLQ